MGWPNYMRTRCNKCGRYVNDGAPGVSWAQSWSTGWGGVPDLHDPGFRCSPCTDKHGIPPTNCNETERKYHGRNPTPSPAQGSGR